MNTGPSATSSDRAGAHGASAGSSDRSDARPAPIDARRGPRGAACRAEPTCEDGLSCDRELAVCASPCGPGAPPCDGACVPTTSGGRCTARCASDRDCRVADGYVCDRTWHACLLPNTAAVVPPACPEPAGRDPAFEAPAILLPDAEPQTAPAAVVVADTLVAVHENATRQPSVLELSRVQGPTRTLHALPRGPREHQRSPVLARDTPGNLYLAWSSIDRAPQLAAVMLSISRDRGATWSSPSPVHDAADCTGACDQPPMVAVGPDPARRASSIVYVMYDAAGLRVRASRDGGASFGPPVTALAGVRGSAAVGADGKLHLVTLDERSHGRFGAAENRIEYTMSSNGGATFARPQLLSTRDELLPYHFARPAIAIDKRRGWLYVAYVRGGRDGRWDLAVLATKDGATWTRTRIGDDPPCAMHMVPSLAVDPTTGRLHVAWFDSRGNRFAHAVCPPGAATCAQAGRIDDGPFPLTTELSGPRSIGERQSLAVDDARRVLHAVWTRPVAEGDRLVPRIFHARAKLR